MANREALKELQTRLAARLQAAAQGADTSASSWLAVEAGGGHFLLPLAQSGEIFPWSHVQSVPYTRPWFLGVANLRGVLTGVVDLAGMLGMAQNHSEQTLSESSLLALGGALEVNAALLVNKLAGLRGAEAFVSSEPPPGDAPPYFGSIYLDAQGTRWQELSLQALSRHPAFLGISV